MRGFTAESGCTKSFWVTLDILVYYKSTRWTFDWIYLKGYAGHLKFMQDLSRVTSVFCAACCASCICLVVSLKSYNIEKHQPSKLNTKGILLYKKSDTNKVSISKDPSPASTLSCNTYINRKNTVIIQPLDISSLHPSDMNNTPQTGIDLRWQSHRGVPCKNGSEGNSPAKPSLLLLSHQLWNFTLISLQIIFY